MTVNQKLIEFLDAYLDKHHLDGLSSAEASRVLEEAGLISDDAQRPGDTVRKLLRDGEIPHAYKEAGKWVIPHSPVSAPKKKPAAAPMVDETPPVSRMKILLRFLYSILYLLVFEILRLVVQLTVLFQYVYLLVVGKPSLPLRRFGNRVSDYTFRVLRYLTLNENVRPYPFSPFPDETAKPDSDIRFE